MRAGRYVGDNNNRTPENWGGGYSRSPNKFRPKIRHRLVGSEQNLTRPTAMSGGESEHFGPGSGNSGVPGCRRSLQFLDTLMQKRVVQANKK